jgi:hypothetical protein
VSSSSSILGYIFFVIRGGGRDESFPFPFGSKGGRSKFAGLLAENVFEMSLKSAFLPVAFCLFFFLR